MDALAKVLLALAGLAFVVAVVTAVTGAEIVGVAPEGFSRACTNLALLSIAFGGRFGSTQGPAA